MQLLNLQIERLSVIDSITLYISFCVKIEKSSPNLLVCRDSWIVCLQTSVCWCNIYNFVWDAAICIQGLTTTLLEHSFVQVFTTAFIFVCVIIIEAVCFATWTQHLCASDFRLQKSRFSLLLFFYACHSTFNGKIRNCIWSGTIAAIHRLQALPLSIHFWSDTIFQFIFGKSKIRRIYIHLQLFKLVCITKYVEKSGRVPTFGVLRSEERKTLHWLVRGSLCSISPLTSSILCNALFTRFSLLNSVLSLTACVFSMFRRFITVCRLQSFIWEPQKILASSFLDSATTLELKLSIFFFGRLLLAVRNCWKTFLELTLRKVHSCTNKTQFKME